MTITQPEILEKYNLHYEKSEQEFNAGNYSGSIEQCLIMWQLIPEPKHLYAEGYYAAKDLFRLYHMQGDLNQALKWAKELLLCDLERYDDGEREFFYGKVNHDLGNFEVAKEYLTIAGKKSKNRLFVGADKKYKP